MKHGSAGTYNRGCRCEECKVARRAYDQDYYRRNQERIKARVRQYELDNPEKVAAASRRWVAANRESVNAAQKRWRSRNRALAAERVKDWERRNPEKVKAKLARYRASPKGRAKAAANRNLRRRGVPFTEEAREYAAILRQDPCSYCGNHAEAIDHITPVAVGGDGEWSNLTAACHACNRRKWTHPLLRFLAAA